MPTDLFLKVDGIAGEAVAAGHVGEITVHSYSWGEDAPTGKVAMKDLVVVVPLSKASPQLLLHCASARHIRKVELLLVKPGSTPTTAPFLRYELSDAVVTMFQENHNNAGFAVPVDTVAFRFARIRYEYRPTNPDGSPGEPVIVGWDVANNSPA